MTVPLMFPCRSYDSCRIHSFRPLRQLQRRSLYHPPRLGRGLNKHCHCGYLHSRSHFLCIKAKTAGCRCACPPLQRLCGRQPITAFTSMRSTSSSPTASSSAASAAPLFGGTVVAVDGFFDFLCLGRQCHQRRDTRPAKRTHPAIHLRIPAGYAWHSILLLLL